MTFLEQLKAAVRQLLDARTHGDVMEAERALRRLLDYPSDHMELRLMYRPYRAYQLDLKQRQDDAVEAEREACAQIADECAREHDNEWNRNQGVANALADACRDIAAAIRARGKDA